MLRRTTILAIAAAALLAAPGAVAKRDALSIRLFASNLAAPTYLTVAPGEPNALYVVEQPGRILVLERGRRRVFLDIRPLVQAGGEQGLLSMAFHPGYERNRRFYVNYTDTKGDTRVVEYRSNGRRALERTARQLLFVDQPYSNHNGGQLQFGPDGKLYVGMGDGGAGGDPHNHGQNLGSRLGKLLRTDPLRVRWQTAGYGLRNPWRFSFDRASGDLYIADVGQGEWEEISYRPRRAVARVWNYGWARFEGRELFKDIRLAGSAPLVQPIEQYSHAQGCSVTGGYVYRGSAIRSIRGRYFYGDYCSGIVWSLRVSGGRARDVRVEPFKVSGLSSFGEDSRGELYLVSLEGRIYRLGGS